jgi:Flp pilus assembly protein TadG
MTGQGVEDAMDWRKRARARAGRALRILLRREEGQAAFELLLVLPFYMLFVLMLVDFGVMMYEYVSVSNAVREGARYGSLNCPTSATPGACTPGLIQQRTVDRSGGILSTTADVTVGWVNNTGTATSANNDRGDSVVVKVNHNYRFLFFRGGSLMGSILPDVSINVFSCADMSLEQKDRTSSLPSGSAC